MAGENDYDCNNEVFLPVLHTSFLITLNLNGQVVFCWWLEDKEVGTMQDCLVGGMH
jgi:hypothetical protein